MGCCNSKPKEKKPVEKPVEKPKPAPKPVARRPPTPRAATPKEVVVEKPDPAKEAARLRMERVDAILAGRESHPYRYDRCGVEGGDVRPLFQEGLVYRITKDGAWYIYNDSLDYEAHVDYAFGPGSQIVPGDRTSLQTLPDGWISAHAVVYPLETIKYISGTYRGFRSNVVVKPVSKEYLSEMARESRLVAERELEAVQRLADGETDEEVILGRCIQARVPYVDVNFPPTDAMKARPGVDAREMMDSAVQRPTQYLSGADRSEADAVVGAVVPESIDSGLLGDCWLNCAAGILAEREEAVRSMFALTQAKERGAGAYRVALSKHGWWRSVIVDDYLPTINNVPLFARIADDPRELWISLLEKAYAKVHGSYATITGGDALQALQDFTGAPTYRFDREWEDAAMNAGRVDAFFRKLAKAHADGYGVVLSTPGHTSTSYLGCRRDSNPEAFRARYASVGLNCGYTYAVQKVVSAGGVHLLKVHNPWPTAAKWTGPWSAGSREWQNNAAARDACKPDAKERNAFWISWTDAMNYFDGGGLIYCTADAVDYRVKGKFEDVVPTVALEINAREATTVTLVLSQQDKRGGAEHDAGLRFAPCMLSVAQHNGRRHVVETNSSWDPATPSSEYNFMVSRDMALTYTFQPSEQPYVVVPRIHRRGVVAEYDRPYTIGIISAQPLDGKLDIRCTHIDGESRVFKNIITFEAGDLPSVEAEHQTHRAGHLPEVAVGEMVVGTAPVRAAKAVSHNSSEAALSQEEEDEQPQEANITDRTGTPVNVAEPEEPVHEGEEAPAESAPEDAPVAATPINDDHEEAEAEAPAAAENDSPKEY